ncbi:MAG: endonuclease [Actinomycetota bacterium]|jgi:endonuclease-8|nr:endonuclease [Actinomycetota bacterium]
MPEGDTVWLAGRRLHDALAGRALTRTDFRVPQLATVDLAGQVVSGVLSRGKHLLTRIGRDLTLHTHFMMDGAWHLYRPGDSWRGGPDFEVRVVLETDEWHAVGYRLPVIELLPRGEEHRAVQHLGPDLLGPDWDLDEALRRLRSRPDREIGDALLDQRNLAGIGNLYKVEVLFLQGVSPFTPVGAVRDLARLVERARLLLEANKDSAWQITSGDGRRGHEHWVYGRHGRPCRRCGTRIDQAMQGEPPYDRMTWWCRHCQPVPAMTPAPSSARPHPR